MDLCEGILYILSEECMIHLLQSYHLGHLPQYLYVVFFYFVCKLKGSNATIAQVSLYTCHFFKMGYIIIIIIGIYIAPFPFLKMFKSAVHCHSLSHSQQRLNGRA